MNLTDLTERVRVLSDEPGTSMVDIAGFFNDAIAKINIRMKANFPLLSPDDPNIVPAFPEKYQLALLIPFAVGRIKQVDSSQFEYNDAYNEFIMGLEDMAADYPVPDIYKDLDSLSATNHSSDIYTAPPFPWGGRW
jgi:hypothetical protein